MAVITPIDYATYSASVPYVTLNEFKFSPTGVDYLSLVPANTTQAQKDTAMQQAIIRASAQADEYCQQVLAATIDWEQGSARVTLDDYGYSVVNVELRRFPVVAVGSILTGTDPSNLSAPTFSGTNPALVKNMLRIPVSLGYVTGTNVPYASTVTLGKHLAYGVQYVNGYANTTLTGTVAQGALSLPVANPLGIAPGQVLTLAAQGSTEYVTVDASWTPVVSTAPTTIPLAAATANAYAAGDSVSALPASVKEAVILLATLNVRTRGQYSIVMSSTRSQPDQIEKDAGPGSADMLADAMDLLEAHRRTR